MNKYSFTPRMIHCADCGAETLATHNRTKFCPECSARRNLEHTKRSHERLRKERMIQGMEPKEPIHLCDSPEKVKMCLNCTKPECTNCLSAGAGYEGKIRKQSVFFEGVRDELIECTRQGMKQSVMARKFEVSSTTIRRWVQRLREEGAL